MRNIITIARRETNLYFISPIIYVVSFMVFLIMGILFYLNIMSASIQQYAPNVQMILGPMVTILLFTLPALTMRTMAEEQRNGTLELLLTAPVRDYELVIGKWLGGFIPILLIILITLVYPMILNRLVSPGIDQGMVITGYIGLILLVSSLVAIGVAMSSFFSNQIAAFFATLAIFLMLWMIGAPAQIMGSSGGATFLSYFDISEHFYNSFFQGVIELKDVIFYLSATALALFLGTISVETRRWR